MQQPAHMDSDSSRDSGLRDSGLSLYRHRNHKQRFELDNYIIKELGFGDEACVFASIPKRSTNQILLAYSDHKISKDKACNKLRAALQAVKISKATFEGDCRTEIEALRNLGKGRTHIVKMAGSDDAEHSWLTIEPLGKTLDSLKSKTRTVKSKSRWFRSKTEVHIPPVAFGWHLIHQLAEAFLELHFGMVSGSSIRGSARYVHGDLHGSNLMFRLPTSSQGYPDLVIIDLGRVSKLDEGSGDKTDFYRAQAMDVVMAGMAIKPILSGIIGNMSTDDGQLSVAFDRLSDCFPQESIIGNRNRRLESLLIELRDEASERRRALYQPLHTETVSYLTEELMSDDELLDKLSQLSARS